MAKKKAKDKTIKVPKLGSLPSIAILQALADLEAAEKNPKLLIDLSIWHDPLPLSAKVVERRRQHKPKAVCSVCFAGVVMARPAGQPLDRTLNYGSFDAPLSNRLNALDDFRRGEIATGLRAWGYDDAYVRVHAPFDVAVPGYDESKVRFKAAMRKMAKDLAAKGF